MPQFEEVKKIIESYHVSYAQFKTNSCLLTLLADELDATLRSNLTKTKRKIAKAQTVHFCAQQGSLRMY